MDNSTQTRFSDLKQLYIAIEQCIRCKKINDQVVNIQPPWDPQRGHKHSPKWGMIIGQAPGHTEMKRGLRLKIGSPEGDRQTKNCEEYGVAFTGRAGQALRKWLEEQAHFTKDELRSNFHKTAVTKCYPGETGKGNDRRPGIKEVNQCRHFLEEEIRLRDPQVLIPMGVQALHWFFPKLDLDQAVGRRLDWQERVVVCLPHSSGANPWLYIKQEHKEHWVRALHILAELRLHTHKSRS